MSAISGTDDGHSPAAGVAVFVDHVVWDMDGTLIDSARVVPAAFVRAVAALGGPPVVAADVVGAYWRGTPEVILAYLVGRELSAAECDAYYRELEGVSVSAYPGVPETRAAGSVSAAAGWGHMFDPAEPADVTLVDPREVLGLLG